MGRIAFSALDCIQRVNIAGLANVKKELIGAGDGRSISQENMQKYINILRDLAAGAGYASLVTKYGVSRQRLHQVVKTFHDAADCVIARRKNGG